MDGQFFSKDPKKPKTRLINAIKLNITLMESQNKYHFEYSFGRGNISRSAGELSFERVKKGEHYAGLNDFSKDIPTMLGAVWGTYLDDRYPLQLDLIVNSENGILAHIDDEMTFSKAKEEVDEIRKLVEEVIEPHITQNQLKHCTIL